MLSSDTTEKDNKSSRAGSSWSFFRKVSLGQVSQAGCERKLRLSCTKSHPLAPWWLKCEELLVCTQTTLSNDGENMFLPQKDRGKVLWWQRWGFAWPPAPPRPAPSSCPCATDGGLSPASLDIWSVSARRPPRRQPLLSSAPCVSTFLWTNTALNNSVCSASTCPGTAVQTRLRGRDVWYPNPGLKKKPRRVRDQLTSMLFLKY